VQISQSGLVKESHCEQKAAKERKTRTNHLEGPGPKPLPVCEIRRDTKICQTRQQNKDVPGTIQQSYPVRDTDHVVVVLVHILACQQENNQDKDSKNEMDFSQAGFLIFNGPNLSSLTDDNVRSLGVDHGQTEPKGIHGLRPDIALACGRCVISFREVPQHENSDSERNQP
jgi:hypothetical protein